MQNPIGEVILLKYIGLKCIAYPVHLYHEAGYLVLDFLQSQVGVFNELVIQIDLLGVIKSDPFAPAINGIQV